MKVSAAIRPTKNAAIHSIVAMNLSIALRGTHSRPPAARISSVLVICPCPDGLLAARVPAFPIELVLRVVLPERRARLLHDRIRIAGVGLAHRVGPLFLQRLARLFPLGNLR